MLGPGELFEDTSAGKLVVITGVFKCNVRVGLRSPTSRKKKLAGSLVSYSRDKLPPAAQVAKQLVSSLVLV